MVKKKSDATPCINYMIEIIIMFILINTPVVLQFLSRKNDILETNFGQI